jgi:Peptidase family C25
MRIHRLGAFVLIAFACTQAYWKIQRDTPTGWAGEFALLPSDTAARIVGIQELAIPQSGTPTIKARFLPKDTSKASSIATSSSVHTWNGAKILHIDIRLTNAQRHSPELSRAKVRLEVSWTGSQTFPLPPLVVNTIGNPIGGARFGGALAMARRLSASSAVPALPSGPVATLTVGDVSKQNHHLVSRTDENGVVRLRVSDLKRVLGNLDGSSLRNIAVYRGPRDTLPSVSGAITAPALIPVKVERIARNPNQLADDDEIRFYVEGTTIWVRDTTAPCGSGWKQSISPYSLTRKYMIALQPNNQAGQASSADIARMRDATTPKNFPTVPQTWRYERHILLKNLPVGGGAEFDDTKTGTNWFWFGTTPINNIASPIAFTGLASDSVCAEVSLAQGSNYYNSTMTSEDSLQVNGIPLTRLNNKDLTSAFWSGRGLKSTSNQLVLDALQDRRFRGYSLHGFIKPRLENGIVEFPTPATGPLSIPFLAPSSSDSLIGYALEDGEIARRVSIVEAPAGDSAGFLGYNLLDSASTLATRYRVSYAANLLAPAALSRWQNNTLAITDFGAESGDSMLVIAPDSFVTQANAFAQYRSQQSLIRKIPTRVVRLEDIYQLYASGQSDPTAIRDFLRWAKVNWGTSHVLLLGHGHYDFRNLNGSGMANIIPTWEVMNYATDNYFTYLDSAEWGVSSISSRTVDMAIGRVPAHNTAEIDAWYAKLKTFETIPPNQDPSWRNTAYLVADDYMTWGKLDPIIAHSAQTEELAQLLLSIRPWLYQDNLYMAKYLPNAAFEKPDVRQAIIGRLDQGVSLFNYIGHGAEVQLAHERVFDLNAVNALNNATTPFLFFAGACDVARFDHTDAPPLGSTVVVTSSKGAMASVSGTRPTFPENNSVIGKEFFGQIYGLDVQARTIGEALTKARNATLATGNDVIYSNPRVTNQDAYVLMGDPSMVFAPTGLQLKVGNLPDTLMALTQIRANATYSSSNSATAVIRFLNSPVKDILTNNEVTCPECTDSVTQPRKQILSSTGTGIGGSLVFNAFVPAKLNFGETMGYSAFGIDTKTGLAGGYYRDSVLILGTNPNANLQDNQGPQVTFRPCDSAFSAGEPFVVTAKIPLPFCLQVQMFDSSGISSSSSPDEGVIVNVPGILDTWRPDLQTGLSFRQMSFQMHFDSTSYKTGTTYALGVLAHDQMGNYTRAQLKLDIQDPGTTGLYDVFNRPNPIKSGTSTTFYFKLSTNPDANSTVPASIQASIRIHTLSGKLIKVLHTDLTQSGSIMPRAVWDLHDDFGNPVANGLYPYTVKLRIPATSGGKWNQIEVKGVAAISR